MPSMYTGVRSFLKEYSNVHGTYHKFFNLQMVLTLQQTYEISYLCITLQLVLEKVMQYITDAKVFTCAGLLTALG